MDVNLALVSGRLALPPEVELLSDGTQRAHLLVCVRSERRGRFDVLPVIVPPGVHTDVLAKAPGGTEVYVAGPLMRRCSPDAWEASGRIQLVASALRLPDVDVEDQDGPR